METEQLEEAGKTPFLPVVTDLLVIIFNYVGQRSHFPSREQNHLLIALSSLSRATRELLIPYAFKSLDVSSPVDLEGLAKFDHMPSSSRRITTNVTNITLYKLCIDETVIRFLAQLPSLSTLSFTKAEISFQSEMSLKQPLRLAQLSIISCKILGSTALGSVVALLVTPALLDVTINNSSLVSPLSAAITTAGANLRRFAFYLDESDAAPASLSSFLQSHACRSLEHLDIQGDVPPISGLSNLHIPHLASLISPAPLAIQLISGRPLRRLQLIPSYLPPITRFTVALGTSTADLVELRLPLRWFDAQAPDSILSLKNVRNLRTLEIYTTLSLGRAQANQCRTGLEVLQQAEEFWSHCHSLILPSGLSGLQYLSLRLNHVHGSVDYHLQAQRRMLNELFSQLSVVSVNFTDGIVWSRIGNGKSWSPWTIGELQEQTKARVAEVLSAKGYKAQMEMISDFEGLLEALYDQREDFRALSRNRLLH